MATRLMLSLKKAAEGPRVLWSLETMTNLSRERSRGDRTLTSRVPDRLREISLTSVAPNEDIELVNAVVRLPPDRWSQRAR